jgi:hypothetical protein
LLDQLPRSGRGVVWVGDFYLVGGIEKKPWIVFSVNEKIWLLGFLA